MSRVEGPRVALSVAGSDPAGGAGVQGDLRAFAAVRVHGVSVLTAIVAQAGRGVRATFPLPGAQVRAQLDALLEDVPVHAAKTGMLATSAAVSEVVRAIDARPSVPWVVDPVLRSSSGAALLDDDGARLLRDELLPRATLVTPNCAELAALLTEASVPRDVDALTAAAVRLRARGARAVLAKGGHLDGDPIDVLVDDEGVLTLPARRIDTTCTRGTGCTLSAAVTGHLARGATLRDAVVAARALLLAALTDARPIGHGASPTDPLGLCRR